MTFIESAGKNKIGMLVNEDGQANVIADTQKLYASVSVNKGKAFNIGTPWVTGVTGSLTEFLWFQNTSTEENFYTESIRVFYNGGNTTASKTTKCTVTGGYTAPTSNFINIPTANFNFTSSRVGPFDVRLWDGVGSGLGGMTGAVGTFSFGVSPGFTSISLEGGFVLGPGQTFVFGFEPELEDGDISVNWVGYMASPPTEV